MTNLKAITISKEIDKPSKEKAICILVFAIIKHQISLNKADKNSRKKEGFIDEEN